MTSPNYSYMLEAFEAAQAIHDTKTKATGERRDPWTDEPYLLDGPGTGVPTSSIYGGKPEPIYSANEAWERYFYLREEKPADPVVPGDAPKGSEAGR